MRKLVSLSVVLFFLFGIVVVSGPAVGAPPSCSCEFCDGRFSTACVAWEEGGARIWCTDYTANYCPHLTAPATEKAVAAAPKPDFFPMEFFGIPSLAVPSYAGPWVAKKAGC